MSVVDFLERIHRTLGDVGYTILASVFLLYSHSRCNWVRSLGLGWTRDSGIWGPAESGPTQLLAQSSSDREWERMSV